MNLEQIGRELQKSGKAEKLRALADSEESRRICELVDQAAVERAAASGDEAALRGILRQILSTDEGKKLAQKLSETMK